MGKISIDNINVENPCAESWEKMQGNDEIRFCSVCEKNVHNLSAMTRADAEKLLDETGGKICVRYYQDAKGETLHIPPKPIKLARRSALAAGVLTTSLVFSATTYAQGAPISVRPNKPDAVSEKSKATQTKTNRRLSSISGFVRNLSKDSESNVQVILENLSTKEVLETSTDENGFYEFSNLAPARYKIKTRNESLELKGRKIIQLGRNKAFKQDITFNYSSVVGGVSSSPTLTSSRKVDVCEDMPPPPLLKADKTDNSSTIFGMITDEFGVAINTKMLLVNMNTGKLLFQQLSGKDGFYKFIHVSPAKYQVMIDIPEGFGNSNEMTFDIAANATITKNIVLPFRSSKTGEKIDGAKLGSVSGIMRDEKGKPLANVKVNLTNSDNAQRRITLTDEKAFISLITFRRPNTILKRFTNLLMSASLQPYLENVSRLLSVK